MAYLPLSTANLPDPVIDPAQGSSPEDYFNTVLYSGDNTSPRSITGVGFDPEFVWVKARTSGSYGHYLWDVVRGTDKNLRSDGTFTESAVSGASNGIVSTNTTDGFVVKEGSNSPANVNGTGETYVAWNWKANGSGVSNTDGSITSTVSANTTSGFSIVSYTGNGSTSGETYGHGLDQSPEMIISKPRETNSLNNWPTWHKSLNANSLVYLNSTTGQVVETGWMPTLPSDTLVYLGTGNTSRELTNNSDVDYIAYCFHSVEGYSKFGSYTGNNSTDGPFVYTGFRPAFLIVKAYNTSSSWVIRDTKRDDGHNDGNITPFMYADATTAEGTISTSGRHIDFLSNGFKVRENLGITNLTNSFIYMAFAENPFKYSNAR